METEETGIIEKEIERVKKRRTNWLFESPVRRVPDQSGQLQKLTLSPQHVERLASVFATVEDMAGFFGVSNMCFYRRLHDDPEMRAAYERGRSKARLSLRRTQFDMATKDKNPALAIWLGKQELGQKERPEFSGTVQMEETRTVTLRWDEEIKQRFEELGAKIEALSDGDN